MKNERSKRAIPVLKFEKIKKDKKKYSIKNNNEIPSLTNKNKKYNNKIRNNNNETISSIDNVSNNEIESNEEEDEENNKYKNNKKKQKIKNKQNKENNEEEEDEKDEQNKSNQSTKIQVHTIDRNNPNIKIQIKSPLSPSIKYQQIDIKTGNKSKSYKFINQNNFRKNKNYIEARDINDNKDNNLVKSIKIKTGLKPLKFNNSNKNSIDMKNKIKNPFCLQNSKSNDSKLNLQNLQNINNENSYTNKDMNHIVGYEKHFGKEENCPLCKSMKKKSQHMEELIFGQTRKRSGIKSFINKEDLIMNQDQKEKNKLKKKFMDFYKKEEEKNINNNLLKDLNPHYTVQSKGKSNYFRDNQRKFSSRRNLSVKNIYNRNETEQSIGNIRDNNFGNMFDVQFPAINSYFHS